MNKRKFVMSLIQNKITRDKDWNLKRVEELLEHTYSTYKPDIIALPESFNTPLIVGGSDKLFYSEFIEDSKSLKVLSDFSKRRAVHVIGGSLPIKDRSEVPKIYNTCVCFDDKGESKAVYRKLHLFDVHIPGKICHKESDKITAGDASDLLTVFETPFAKFGIGICYDIRFIELAYLLKLKKSVDMLVYPSAFPVVTGTMHWDLLMRARAMDNQVWTTMISPSRNYEDQTYFQCYGYSSFVNPYGHIINNIGYEEGVVTSEIDLSLNTSISNEIPIWKQKRYDLYELTCSKSH